MAQRVVIPGFRKIEISGGGEGGTTNYDDLANKPSINNVPLVGNLNTVNLKLTDATLTEEGVPAEAKTVGTKLEEQSTSLTDLSRKLGNHTVKSDVPENAVFTDTVYDDTEVKESIEELNSNLDTLEFGEVAGGKNLLDPKYFASKIIEAGGIGNVDEVSWECNKVDWYKEDLTGISFKDNTVYTIVIYGKCQNENNTSANLAIEYTDGTNSTIRFKIKNTKSLTLFVTQGNKTISKLMFDYGSVGTDLEPKKCGIFEGVITESNFEPYIPSVKMIADENAQQNTEAMDLKMLGWTVPSECPIQNEVNGNQFIQKVGRVDLGSLNWVNESYAPSHFYAQFTSIKNFTEIEKANIFCTKYTATSTSDASNQSLNKVIVSSNQYIAVDDNSYTDATTFKNAMQGEYLYYELATPITMTIDGNEAVTQIKNDLSGNDKVVVPLLNNCTGELYYHKIGDLIVVNGVVNIPKANGNVKVAVLPNSKVNQSNAFTIYNFTDDTHDSEYATRYASDSSLVIKVPIANKDYIISGCYIGN